MQSPAGSPLAATHLHALAALLDLAGLALLILLALLWLPAEQADRRALLLTLATVPIAFVVFAVMPRRVALQPEAYVERRSLFTYVTLGFPPVFTLLTLLLMGLSRSFDSFAGFALLLAADAGRNLWEWLRHHLAGRP